MRLIVFEESAIEVFTMASEWPYVAVSVPRGCANAYSMSVRAHAVCIYLQCVCVCVRVPRPL